MSTKPYEDAVFRHAARLRMNERGLTTLKLRGHIVQDGRRVKALARGIRENHVLHTLDMRKRFDVNTVRASLAVAEDVVTRAGRE